MIEPYQFPETCSCCNSSTSSGGSSGGSGGGGSGDDDDCNCILFGELAPEGVVTADRGRIYRRRNDEYYEFYFKDSGDGTPFGWTLYHQVAAPTV